MTRKVDELADAFRLLPEEVSTSDGSIAVRWQCESGHSHPLRFAAEQCNRHKAMDTIYKWRFLTLRSIGR